MRGACHSSVLQTVPDVRHVVDLCPVLLATQVPPLSRVSETLTGQALRHDLEVRAVELVLHQHLQDSQLDTKHSPV